MVSGRFESAVASLVTKARLLERLLHDPGPWTAHVYGCQVVSVPLERHEREDDHVILTGYVRGPVTGISAIEILCAGQRVASWPAGGEDAPVRITLGLGISNTELAAW